MRVSIGGLMSLGGLLAAACGGQEAETVEPVSPEFEVSSTDFAILPCGPGEASRPCALVMAGGKRVLMGAPDGTRASLDADDLKQLDAVLLFSLRGSDIEGLGPVRNASWLEGRGAALSVVGPLGIDEVIDALNTAYEASDALAYVEHGASGGFDAALLTARRASGTVFDTGDLIISAREESGGAIGYTISYDGMRAQVLPCGHPANGKFTPSDTLFVLACDEARAAWPVTEPIMVRTDRTDD